MWACGGACRDAPSTGVHVRAELATRRSTGTLAADKIGEHSTLLLKRALLRNIGAHGAHSARCFMPTPPMAALALGAMVACPLRNPACYAAAYVTVESPKATTSTSCAAGLVPCPRPSWGSTFMRLRSISRSGHDVARSGTAWERGGLSFCHDTHEASTRCSAWPQRFSEKAVLHSFWKPPAYGPSRRNHKNRRSDIG